MEVRDGLRDPELRALIRIGDKMTLAKLRSDIMEVENDARALWLKNQSNSFGYNSPGFYRGLGQSPETAIQRGRGAFISICSWWWSVILSKQQPESFHFRKSQFDASTR